MKAAVVMVRNLQDQIGSHSQAEPTKHIKMDRQEDSMKTHLIPLPHLLLRKSDLKDSTLGQAARVQMAHCLWIFCPRLQPIWTEMSEKRAHVLECSLAPCCSPNTMRLFTRHLVFYVI